jgi:hypothetical protein
LLQLLEFLLPIVFVGIIVSIKKAVMNSDKSIGKVHPAFLPDDQATFIPLTFDDYVVALAAERTCIAAPPVTHDGYETFDTFWISGLSKQSDNWPIPFVKCDSQKCDSVGQDAQPFCEYGILAVSGKDEDDKGGNFRAMQFQAWLYDRYPALVSDAMPFEHDFCQVFPSEQSMSDYVLNKDYGSLDMPKIIMGIVFEGNDDKVFKYTMRQNSTNYNKLEQQSRPSSPTTPDTSTILSSYAKADDACWLEDGSPELGIMSSSCTGLYVYNGLLPIQRTINDFIMNITLAADKGYYVSEAGMAFAPFPGEPYEESGFFVDAGSKFALQYLVGDHYLQRSFKLTLFLFLSKLCCLSCSSLACYILSRL